MIRLIRHDNGERKIVIFGKEILKWNLREIAHRRELRRRKREWKRRVNRGTW